MFFCNFFVLYLLRVRESRLQFGYNRHNSYYIVIWSRKSVVPAQKIVPFCSISL